MKTLTYEFLLTCSPFFECDILGGWKGKNNSFHHFCLNERPENKESISLIEVSNESMNLLEQLLSDKHTTGVLLIDDGQSVIPSSCINLAEQCNKPLLLLKGQYSETIIKKLSEIFFLYKNNLLHLIMNDLRSFIFQIFHQDGIEQCLHRFQQMFGQEISILNNKLENIYHSLISFKKNDFMQTEVIYRGESSRLSIITNENKEFYMLDVLSPKKKVICYILFEKKSSIEKLQIHKLEALLPTLISWFKQMDITKKIHSIYKDQFLFDILHNNIETESEMIELANLRNMKFTSNSFVLSINLESQQIISKSIISDIKNMLIDTYIIKANIYTTYLNHRIVALVFPEHDGLVISKADINHWIRNVQQKVKKKFPNIHLLFGIGNSYHSILNIHKSFQESKIALHLESYGLGSDGIIHYEDTGFIRLLSYIHNDLLKEFSHIYLGKLRDYDRENDTELLHTLATYFNQNGDITKTADTLFIHQNTLRQRLRKIETILNINLQNYNDLVNLLLSIKISYDMNL